MCYKRGGRIIDFQKKMDLSFEIDESISRAQKAENLNNRLDMYHDIITKMETIENFNFDTLKQLEIITYDVSEIAKKHCVLNKEEVIEAHKKIQKYIKDFNKSNKGDLALLTIGNEISAFLHKFAFYIEFMQSDLIDKQNHPVKCRIEPVWILLALVALFGLYAALYQFFDL